MSVNSPDRYSVISRGKLVGKFAQLHDAEKALTQAVKQWRSERDRNVAMMQDRVYDYIPKTYTLKYGKVTVGQAYIWDHKGESPAEVNKALDHHWQAMAQLRREQEEARGEAPWQKEIAGG